MRLTRRAYGKKASGTALVITLAILLLVTILVVGMLSMVRLERASARNVFSAARARALTEMAADQALASIRDAISAAESTATNTTANGRKFWASQPGQITVFNADGTIDTAASRALYSTNTGPAAPTVDLNVAPFGGVAPIIANDGSGSAPVMAVPWVNVLSDPSASASATNPLIGRYAFWVDDESTKLNINTSDGSMKDSATSFGPGSPAEVSLKTLAKASGTMTTEEAAAISKLSGALYVSGTVQRPFNSIREILQVEGITPDVYELNFQDLTVFNRAPELNIFGEPRIYLTPVTGGREANPSLNPLDNTPLSLITGPYADLNAPPLPNINDPSARNRTVTRDTADNIRPQNRLDWIYPSAGLLPASAASNSVPNSQLPPYVYTYLDNNGNPITRTVRLPQFFHDELAVYLSGATGFPSDGYLIQGRDYEMGARIARYLKGFNSQNNPIKWPDFSGAGPGGFAGKYSDRQIDELTLQILSLLKQMYPDHYQGWVFPYYIKRGWLSNKPVRGLARGPRLTEVTLQVTTIAGDPPLMKMRIICEYFLSEEYQGTEQNIGYWRPSANAKDLPASLTTEADLGGYWADKMLKVLDQNGNPAGVDLMGADPTRPDPDQLKAAQYHHPWALETNTGSPNFGKYLGSGPARGIPVDFISALNSGYPTVQGSGVAGLIGTITPDRLKWKRGEYRTSSNYNFQFTFPMKSGTTAIKLEGGLSFWLKDSAGRFIEMIPLDGAYSTDEATLLNAVIPIPQGSSIPIPGQAVYHMQVADPMVNNFPGDWQGEILTSPTDTKITMPVTNAPAEIYTTGRNTISAPSAGGDSQTPWWPEQDVNIPKSQRFPSSGYLQYLHTGVMPDLANEAKPLREQMGTPFRLLNFSPSTSSSQQTAGGQSYPDWAMLDLFTTPAIFQPLGTPVPDPIIRTWGGASAGRINPNAVLAPFGISRTKPLEALFADLKVSASSNSSGEPVETTMNGPDLARSVTSYVKALGRPLMLPGEICNVPEIAASVYADVNQKARSRNDLVRQTIGNLTTRSNTFTVWAVGEVIQKKPGNSNYGVFEYGDYVLGRKRMRFAIERYLDPGSDGIYGNSVNPGADGTINTPDDPVTATTGAHPTMSYPLPYKYRVVEMSHVE